MEKLPVTHLTTARHGDCSSQIGPKGSWSRCWSGLFLELEPVSAPYRLSQEVPEPVPYHPTCR